MVDRLIEEATEAPRREIPRNVCSFCQAIFPEGWPADPVSQSHSLVPVDAARHILAFTQILHGVDITKCHRRCLKQNERWLADLKRSMRSLRVTGMDRGMLDLWVRLVSEAHEKIEAELAERPRRATVPGSEVRRVVRRAMDAVGWEDFGLETNARGDRAVITYADRHRKRRTQHREEFEARVCRQLGADFDLRIEYRRLIEEEVDGLAD